MKRSVALAFALFFAFHSSGLANVHGRTQAASQSAPVAIAGDWLGVLTVQGLKLRLALRVSRSDDGVLTAKLDSLDQGARDLPVEEIVHDGDTVRFASKRLGLSYTGTLVRGSSIIRGEMTQGGATMTLNFERVASIPALKRSQEPVKPYGYVEHEVRYTNKKDQAELAGTLTIPAGTGPHPAVVLITGSGAQDRDETIAGHRPFLVLADYLTRRGIAVLRADDRGVGASSAAASTDTSLTYAGDVLAAVEFLKQRSDIAPQKIGLIGHSEGGMIAAMAAARSRDVAFVVMMAGIGRTGEEVILAQTELMQRKYGVEPELIEVTRTTLKDVFQALRTEPNAGVALEQMRAVLDERAAAMPEGGRQMFEGVRNMLLPQLRMYTTAWFRFFLDYDPAPDLRGLRVPLLAVTGELDVQAPPRENLQRIQAAARAEGNQHVTVRELTGLNHLLQTAKTGLPDEYSTIEETFAPTALELIAQWIQKSVASGAGSRVGRIPASE